MIIATAKSINMTSSTISRSSTIDIESPYVSPEVLLGIEAISTTADMWSFGCILAGWVFQKAAFFSDDHRSPYLLSMIKVSGRWNDDDEDMLMWVSDGDCSYGMMMMMMMMMMMVKMINYDYSYVDRCSYQHYLQPPNNLL